MRLFTVGHGTVDAGTLASRLQRAGVERLVDVRRFPASRRWPQFDAAAMATWLPEAGIAYVPCEALGGRRRADPNSPNVGLREPGFRGYADHMRTPAFREAFATLVDAARERATVVACSETLWWRCHRRLIADAAMLLAGATVEHLLGERVAPHRPTAGVRVAGDTLIYDG